MGPSDELRPFGINPVKHLPGVGRSMKNHPSVSIVFKSHPDHHLAPNAPRNQVGLRFTAQGSSMRNDIQVQPTTSYPASPTPPDIRFGCRIEYSYSEGLLTLASADVNQQPNLDFRFLTDPRDLPRYRDAVRRTVAVFQHPAFDGLLTERLSPTDADLASDDSLDAWLQQNGRHRGPPVSHVQDGSGFRPDNCGGPILPCARPGGAAGGRRLGHARHRAGQHQRHRHHDRRTGSPTSSGTAGRAGVAMTLPESTRFDLAADMSVCRILNGMWQVSGAHGRIEPNAAIRSMFDYVDAGFTTWDLADHYGPAEDFIGEFRRQFASARGEEALSDMLAFTKWVPRPGPMTRQVVEGNVDISRRRMGMERLDLLQFHWWDYSDARYLDALSHLADLRDEGWLREVALTNFDTQRMRDIAGHGVRVVSNQVQYSLIDRRPEVAMAGFCEGNGSSLLAYGTLCGGLLSDRYLGPAGATRGSLNTASLGKYKQMVDAWGGWGLFQQLLTTLKSVADKHGATIANVAVRYVLDRPAVAGVIVGTRLGVAEHIAETARVFDLRLDADDVEDIEAVLAQSRDLYRAHRRLRRRVPAVATSPPAAPARRGPRAGPLRTR